MSSEGSFTVNGREFTFRILSIEGEDGSIYNDNLEDHLHEADRVYYVASVEDSEGEREEFYRWLGGPYESMSDVEAAIEDEGQSEFLSCPLAAASEE